MANSEVREDELSWRKRIVFRELGILLALLFMVGCLSLFAPRFLESENLFNVLRQFSFITIIAIGQTFVITAAGIDLSVGSVAGLAGIVTCSAIATGMGVTEGVLVGLLTGALCGLFNGIVVAYIKLPSFIVTLAMMSLARGFVYVITQGRPIVDLPRSFFTLGQASLGPVPVPVIIMFAFVGLGYLLLNRTGFGRKVTALGANEQVALLTGLAVNKIKVAVFTISGFCSAVAGVLLASRLNSGQPSLGSGYELDAVAAVVIGGTSLFGGWGSIFGTLIGAAIMGVMRNGLVLLNVSAYWQSVAVGVVILLACSIDRIREILKRRGIRTGKQSMRWVYAGLAVLLVLVLTVSFRARHSTHAGASRKLTIAVVPKLIHPYFEAARQGAEEEGAKLGVNILWQAPLTADPAYQAQIMEDLISKRVDAIAVSPVDDRVLIPFLARAKSEGIPVLTWDADCTDKSLRIAYVGTDNVEAGRIAGKEASRLAGNTQNKEYAVMTGSLGAANLNQRLDGFEEALHKNGNYTRAALEASDDNADKSLSQAESILRGHPNLSLIFAVTGTGTPQAAKAVREAGRAKQVTVVGFDALDDTLQAVRDGSVSFIVAQRPHMMGALAVRFLYRYLHGEKLPDNTDTGAVIVTRQNVDNF
jgi:ribose/xylose/arabinose/galactoside ABC-type transport system permease subunit/ABC-type sugar transport system substrate-binding protein